MKLSELLRKASVSPIRTVGDAEITSVAGDSRRCREGCCFVAVKGTQFDGHDYVPAAISGGTSAIVCENLVKVPDDVAAAVVKDSREALGRLAQAMADWPARKLVNLGVTGTNGKTTVAVLLRSILSKAGCRPSLLGTIRYETGSRDIGAAHTTPGAVELAGLMGEMLHAARTHLVMEVSSHAMDQRRLAGVEFRVAVFTNLTGDHLDYHGSMEAYLAAKKRLFDSLSPDAVAVINADDAAGERIVRDTPARVLRYAMDNPADLRARIENAGIDGTAFRLIFAGGETLVRTPLIGRHNVYNCLAAAAAAIALGIDAATITNALENVSCIPGRLQRIASRAPFDVFVDYAHTDDALANVLEAIRPIVRGRVLLVFGCGGDRDRSKRPRMARVAERLADRIMVTSDNPRTEAPAAIIDEILAGLGAEARRRAAVQPDRRKAIAMAIDEAAEGDIVLIAGKGHEDYQIIGHERIHFDDVETAEDLLRLRGYIP